jgi:plasmid stabilization system protein ParE
VKIKWTAGALWDLDAFQAHHLGLDRRFVARLAREVQRTIGRLSEFPHSGRPGRLPATREAVVPNTPVRPCTGWLRVN